MSICANLWSEKTICGLSLFCPQIITDITNHPHGRPRRINNRNSIASKQSQLCCVDNHEQPRRGESLFARTGPAGQALSPLYPEGKGDLGESGGAPYLRVKKGTGDDFRKSPSRRGRVR